MYANAFSFTESDSIYRYDSRVNKCYHVTASAMTYGEAEIYCYHGEAKMAEPKNYAENNAVSNLSTGRLWIGINDIDNERSFVYESTGQRITYSNWAAGEPNNLHNEDGVVLNYVRYTVTVIIILI